MNERYVSRAEMLDIRGPAVVLTDNLFSLFALLIRRGQLRQHTDGQYNHAMMLYAPGAVVSQNWRLESGDLREYLDGKHRVKVIECPFWRADAIQKLNERMRADVGRATRYDWLGVIGQALGMPGVHFPGRYYCSEYVGEVLRATVEPHAPIRPSPAQLNQWFKFNHNGSATVRFHASVYDPEREGGNG